MATAEPPPAPIEREEGKAGVGGPEQEAEHAGGGLMQRFKAAVGLGGKEEAGKREGGAGGQVGRRLRSPALSRSSKAAQKTRLAPQQQSVQLPGAAKLKPVLAGDGGSAAPAAPRWSTHPLHSRCMPSPPVQAGRQRRSVSPSQQEWWRSLRL